jgi:hypothetical protein
MSPLPAKDLNRCSVNHCGRQTDVLVQKRVGEAIITYSYCAFHGVIAATLFPNPSRKEIRI